MVSLPRERRFDPCSIGVGHGDIAIRFKIEISL